MYGIMSRMDSFKRCVFAWRTILLNFIPIWFETTVPWAFSKSDWFEICRDCSSSNYYRHRFRLDATLSRWRQWCHFTQQSAAVWWVHMQLVAQSKFSFGWGTAPLLSLWPFFSPPFLFSIIPLIQRFPGARCILRLSTVPIHSTFINNCFLYTSLFTGNGSK